MDLWDAIRDLPSEEQEDGRIYGAQYGSVTDITDPKGLGRVRARVGAQGPRESTDWLIPLWPGAIESIPRAGDPVIVLFVDGDPNRGCYAWHANSRTQGRPTEAMVLGTTMLGLYNDLVTKHNTLKGAFNALVSSFNGHLHSGVTAGGSNTGATTSGGSADGSADAALGKAANGAIPAAIASSERVLSGEAKVR